MNTIEEQEGLDTLIRALELVSQEPEAAKEAPVSKMILSGDAGLKTSYPAGNQVGRRDESIVDMARKTRESNLNSPMFTNVPEVAARTPGATLIEDSNSFSSTPGQTKMSGDIFAGIKSQMELIGKEVDPLKKDAALSSLKGSIAETSAQLNKQARIMAEQEVGLPQLESALKRAEQLDRADPLWSQHLVDSKETQGIRNQVMRAQDKALQLSKRMILENPTILGMNATVESFLKTQESLIQKDLSREDKRKDLIDQEMLTLGTDTTKYLSYLYPEVGGDVRKAAEIKLSSRTDPNKKELAPILSTSFTEDQLLPLAFSGNKPAQMIAVKAHSEKTGQDEEKTKKELSTAHRFVNDEAFFQEKMKEASASDPYFKTVLSEYTKAGLLGGKDKESMKQRMIQRAGIVDQWITKQKTTQALSDVESWNGNISLKADPEIAAAIDRIKTVQPGKPVSIDALIGDYVLSSPKEQRADRLDKIKVALKSTVENSKKGLYGHLDEVAMLNKLKISQGLSSASFGAFLDAYGDTMAQYINTNPGVSGSFTSGVR